MPDKHFTALTPEERDALIQAPVLVTLLIAGADQDFSKKEINWAKKVIHYRTFTSHNLLHDYYEMVNAGFEDSMSTYLDDEASTLDEATLTVRLAGLNDVLPKIDPLYAKALVDSLRSLAQHVAEADGGLLGFHKISTEEQTVVDLPMIKL